MADFKSEAPGKPQAGGDGNRKRTKERGKVAEEADAA